MLVNFNLVNNKRINNLNLLSHSSLFKPVSKLLSKLSISRKIKLRFYRNSEWITYITYCLLTKKKRASRFENFFPLYQIYEKLYALSAPFATCSSSVISKFCLCNCSCCSFFRYEEASTTCQLIVYWICSYDSLLIHIADYFNNFPVLHFLWRAQTRTTNQPRSIRII